MTPRPPVQPRWQMPAMCATTALLALGLLGGCAGLLPKPPAAPTLHTLDDGVAPSAVAATPPGIPNGTLIVAMPRAAAGFDTPRIVYLRRPHELAFFADSQWVDTPAQMLAPLIVRALQAHGDFAAVVAAPSTARGTWRLDTELIRLQQDFGSLPSTVRLTLRAVLIDSRTQAVVASEVFDANVAATRDDASGGVGAANQAVREVLVELARFSGRAVAR